jgi:hypothetical protein
MLKVMPFKPPHALSVDNLIRHKGATICLLSPWPGDQKPVKPEILADLKKCVEW